MDLIGRLTFRYAFMAFQKLPIRRNDDTLKDYEYSQIGDGYKCHRNHIWAL